MSRMRNSTKSDNTLHLKIYRHACLSCLSIHLWRDDLLTPTSGTSSLCVTVCPIQSQNRTRSHEGSASALVPQLRNVYRFGIPRDCTWRWKDFKYCLSLKSEPQEVRRELWIKRRADWWAKRRVEGSSEDVWALREYVSLYEKVGD